MSSLAGSEIIEAPFVVGVGVFFVVALSSSLHAVVINVDKITHISVAFIVFKKCIFLIVVFIMYVNN